MNPNPIVKIKKLSHTAQLPKYQTAGAAGMDLHADIGDTGPWLLQPGERKLVPTNLALAIPDGYEGQMRSRSGLSLKQALIVLNAPGTIDSDYRGPLGVILFNAGQDPQVVRQGDRIAQLVISPVSKAEVIEVSSLDDTTRGIGAFGSTGV